MMRLFKKISDEMKKRVELVKQTMAHRQAMQEVSKAFGYSFPLHDLDKVFMYPILGKRLTEAVHNRFSGHHLHNGNIRNKIEAALDWESAALTTTETPLDAMDTWLKFYSQVDMEPTFRQLGMLSVGNITYGDIWEGLTGGELDGEDNDEDK